LPEQAVFSCVLPSQVESRVWYGAKIITVLASPAGRGGSALAEPERASERFSVFFTAWLCFSAFALSVCLTAASSPKGRAEISAEKPVFQQSKGAFRRPLRKKFRKKLFSIPAQAVFHG
jgi:hypothetical protein